MQYLLNPMDIEEVQMLFNELDGLLQRHFEWLERLYRSLFGGEPADPRDIDPNADALCAFGRWLDGPRRPVLERSGALAELTEIHRQMHQEARRLLLKAGQGLEVGQEEYTAFRESATALRLAIIRMEAALKQNLRAASRLSARIFENAAEAVVITDPSAVIVDVNRAFTRVTGYSREEALGQHIRLLRSGRHGGRFYEELWGSLNESGHWQGEIWNRRRNGEVYPEWLTITAMYDDGGERISHYVAMFSDITTAKQNEERLYRLAHYDPLTGLANRGLFYESLGQALTRADRSGKPAAVLFLDLDRFKVVNDTLGHTAGDALLIDVAHRLKSCVRDSDLVGRQGGDEFTIILDELDDRDSAALVARKIHEVMAVPFTLDGQELFVTTSIGISVYPEHGTDADFLIKAADIAMYGAKEDGRDTYQFYRPGGEQHLSELFELETALRHALERTELRLHYQPQVDIESEQVVGVEALLRWEHPARGMLTPGEFMPIAEETGIINAIGRWVLEEACLQAKRWQEDGLGRFRISVNLSARQLRQKDLPRQVAAALHTSGLEPQLLQIELTETSLMQNPATATDLLREIHELGVTISIDNFGSGYTGLGYLKRFSIDALKIDRSFIEGVARNRDDQAISRAIIALAESLGLKVVAEGVETDDQLSFLRDNHCCDAQGFLFGRPIPPEEFGAILARRRR